MFTCIYHYNDSKMLNLLSSSFPLRICTENQAIYIYNSLIENDNFIFLEYKPTINEKHYNDA